MSTGIDWCRLVSIGVEDGGQETTDAALPDP
jgi:hypothetical protein